jgi:hypothetical protein
MSFLKNGEQEGKTDPVWDWYQWWWGGEDIRNRMYGGEYGGNTTYLCMKMEK